MKKTFIAISVLLLAITSCSDFLDSDIRSDFNYNNYFQTEKDLISFANGMFGGLITWTWEGGGL
ncbi:MAG: RagB/SusD family nutrient uptake outer membrane protein, partial [Bacteroidales bacterium]|nr:RagB/SusD family nutrient uptake outer membrane protein [Bacteroidales bacterium]